MLNRVRARGVGSGAGNPEKAKKVKFRCETCQIGESYRPCRPEVVWGDYMQNPHLMETGWAYRVQEDEKFDIITVDGKRHALVLCPMPQAPSQDAAAAPFREGAIQLWKSRTFGRASILDALEKSPDINFSLDDQTHWLDQSKTQVVPRPSRMVEVVDTEGKRYSVPRPGRLAKHKVEAFQQWKDHIIQVSRRLMGQSVAERFELRINPLWAKFDSEYRPQPVGSETLLDEFDWGYDAEPSQDLEEHVARVDQIMY